MPNRKPVGAKLPVPVELVARRIRFIRGQRVMIDRDLAEIYEVETRALNQAVQRNIKRFPQDFMFQLTEAEMENWKSQIVMSNPGAKMGLRKPPYAFTEHGVAMLSSVLNSDRAVQMNITIIRAFIKMREILSINRALAEKIERLTATQKEHTALFDAVIADIQRLDYGMRRLQPPPRRRKVRIGFHVPS
jgi:phage regulator Rha-like protein